MSDWRGQSGAWRAYADFAPYSQMSKVLLAKDSGDRLSILKPATIVDVQPGSLLSDDSWMQGREEDMRDLLRALMSLGWSMGLRPDGYENHTNELQALRGHLSDMRKLVGLDGSPVLHQFMARK